MPLICRRRRAIVRIERDWKTYEVEMAYPRIMLAGLVAALIALPEPGVVSADDLDSTGRTEVIALQQRLVDAGCYKGAVDGLKTPALVTATKSCPDQNPVLRIDTGMHSGTIADIAADAECRVVATGSLDKTIRLWSMPSGRLLRTRRMPIGDGPIGLVYAVAVSPDGARMAAGGVDGRLFLGQRGAIQIFDVVTGASVQRLPVGGVVDHLSFSPDGRRLAAALGSRGIRVFDIESGRLLMSDASYGDGETNLSFGPDGSLYAVAEDGLLRRYGPNLKRALVIRAPDGQIPRTIAVQPVGGRLAIGYKDGKHLDIFDAARLRHIGGTDASGIDDGALINAVWSRDGQNLFASGTYSVLVDGRYRRMVRVFDADGRRVGSDSPASFNTIHAMALCGDGVVFAASDPSFGTMSVTGKVATLGAGSTVDMRGKLGDAFAFSADGTQVRFGSDINGNKPVLFDLAAGTLTDAPAPIPGLIKADVTGLDVTNWEDSQRPLLHGKPFVDLKGDSIFSYALADQPDRTGFVLGLQGNVIAYDAQGKMLWYQDVGDAVFGVNLARHGDLVVAASGDGTIRWHRWSDGKELLALFVDKNDRRFIAWTPTGYYMASPGAEDLIGWHVNRGWEQPADFFPASRFRDRFNRPDIVRLVLQTLDEDAAVKQANDAAHKHADTNPLIARLPPILHIVSPTSGATFATGELAVSYAVRSPSGLPVDRIDVLIDGVRQQDRGFNRLAQPGSGESQGTLSVHLPERDVEVALVVHSGELSSEPAKIRLRYAGAARGDDLLKPKLYALVAGVSDYADASLKLGYAGKDARDFGATLQAQTGGLYGRVEVRVIVDREATRTNLIHGLKWLEKQVTSRDVGIVFLAGHGVIDAQQAYWFLPTDATPEDLDASAVSQDDIKRSLNGLAGKAILFLDSCHAGQIGADGVKQRGTLDINKVVGDFAAADNGVVVFASSTGREVSQERDTWSNGAFTKALIEGIAQGKADLLHHDTITLTELDAFVADRVKDLTDGEQHPVMTKPTTVPDYPIALARK